MKPFLPGPKPPTNTAEPPPPSEAASPPPVPEPPRQISLSAEQKSILERPIDPRVDRILQQIYADRAAAECALTSARRVINFPLSDSGERHVIQDKDGFWRIMPGPAPELPVTMLDAL